MIGSEKDIPTVDDGHPTPWWSSLGSWLTWLADMKISVVWMTDSSTMMIITRVMAHMIGWHEDISGVDDWLLRHDDHHWGHDSHDWMIWRYLWHWWLIPPPWWSSLGPWLMRLAHMKISLELMTDSSTMMISAGTATARIWGAKTQWSTEEYIPILIKNAMVKHRFLIGYA